MSIYFSELRIASFRIIFLIQDVHVAGNICWDSQNIPNKQKNLNTGALKVPLYSLRLTDVMSAHYNRKHSH